MGFFSSVLHLPLGFGELQACLFSDVVFPRLFLSALSSSPFHCALKDGFLPHVMRVHQVVFYLTSKTIQDAVCLFRGSKSHDEHLPIPLAFCCTLSRPYGKECIFTYFKLLLYSPKNASPPTTNCLSTQLLLRVPQSASSSPL